MNGPLFLGIDVGTTSVKASVVDSDFQVIVEASAGYPTSYVRPSWVEQHPEDWWAATLDVLGRLAAEAPSGTLSGVAAVSVSSQAPTLLSLDRSGEPVRPALIWMDRRATDEAEALADSIGREEYVLSGGNRADPFFVAPKLLWLRNHEPESLRRTACFVQINGYIAFRLTGELSIDDEHASLLGLRDIRTGDWNNQLLSAVGASVDQFPAVAHPTSVIGHVVPSVARVTGLSAGTPVTAGTVDSAAAALEAGVVSVGQAAEMTGTSTVVIMPIAAPVAQAEFITMASTLPGQWLHLAAMVSTGASLKWLRDLVARDVSFDDLTAQAAEVTPGAEGLIFHPYMMGERSPLWSTAARGTFVGLTLGAGVPQLSRAVLEGTAFALRHNLEVAARAGRRPDSLRSTGAPASSDVWSQLKADITGVPIVRMKAPTGATFGGALIAAAATGHIDDIAAASSASASVDREFEPDARNADLYTDLFAIYRSTYEHLSADLDRLARLRTREDDV